MACLKARTANTGAGVSGASTSTKELKWTSDKMDALAADWVLNYHSHSYCMRLRTLGIL